MKVLARLAAALRQHWGIALVGIVALVISATIYFALRPAALDLTRYEYPAPPALNLEFRDHSCREDVLALIGDRAEAARARERCAREAESLFLQNNDLIQQMREADAAQAQARLQRELAWMGVYGTIGGFLTLIAAAAAAFYARGAAHAASYSLDHSKMTANAELRPWVDLAIDIEPTEMTGEGLTLVCALSLTNIGRTPAQNIRILHSATTLHSPAEGAPDDVFDNMLGSEVERGVAILPGREHRELERIAVAWRMDEADLSKGIVAFVGLCVSYELPDGAVGMTAYSYWIGMPQSDRPGDLKLIPNSQSGPQELIGLKAYRASQTRVV